tara:strand:+ start:23798 stop:25177 length:1380 start_codon:yes stop_codon:yes gene_type:complete
MELYKVIYKKLVYNNSNKNNNFVFSCTNFTVDKYTTTKDKYNDVKQVYDSEWLSNKFRNEVIDNLQLTNKVYFGFHKLYINITSKTTKHHEYYEDLCGNSLLSLNESCKIRLYENNMYYTFRISDIINIIRASLTYNDYFVLSPKQICNPFTNKPFSLSNHYNIYYYLKQSNYNIPNLYNYYYQCNFNRKIMAIKYDYEIKEYIITKHVNELTPNKIIKRINEMLFIFKPLLKSISVSKYFPKDKLIEVFTPFLKYYYIVQNTHNSRKMYYTREYLLKKIIMFDIQNKMFGRIIISRNKKLLFDKESNKIINKITREKKTYTECVPFYKLDINKVPYSRLADVKEDTIIRIFNDHSHIIHDDYEFSDDDDSYEEYHDIIRGNENNRYDNESITSDNNSDINSDNDAVIHSEITNGMITRHVSNMNMNIIEQIGEILLERIQHIEEDSPIVINNDTEDKI